MSTVLDSIAGKGRGLGTNFWITSLIILLVIFGANTGYAGWKAARLGGASTSASSLQARLAESHKTRSPSLSSTSPPWGRLGGTQ